MREIAERLCIKYGQDVELRKVLEEMCELSNEIYRDINHCKASRMNILEERVDVELMLNMLDYIYDFTEKDVELMWEIKKKKIEGKYIDGK